MIEFFNSNQHAFWFTLGFILLALETLVLAFSTGVVLFAGFGALLTGCLLWFHLLPNTWLFGIASFGISSTVIAMLLWKPLLKLQDHGDAPAKDNSSDIIGHEFYLENKITRSETGKVDFSGISWRVEIEQGIDVSEIDAGSKVSVTSVDAGIFRVKPITKPVNETA